VAILDAVSVITDPGPHLFWITSRAAGTAALAISSAAVALGLLMSTRLLKERGPDARVAHEALSLAAMLAIAVHGVSLIGDHFLHPTLLDVTVPFAGSYKTVWTSMGIIAGWGMIILGISYYFRRRIGQQRWRALHRFTALAWLLGLGHTLGEGTDAGQAWFLTMIAIVAVPAGILLLARVSRGYDRPEPALATPQRTAGAGAAGRRGASAQGGRGASGQGRRSAAAPAYHPEIPAVSGETLR
jgi:methionine sulfoxide reductase heme-binding subunit